MIIIRDFLNTRDEYYLDQIDDDTGELIEEGGMYITDMIDQLVEDDIECSDKCFLREVFTHGHTGYYDIPIRKFIETFNDQYDTFFDSRTVKIVKKEDPKRRQEKLDLIPGETYVVRLYTEMVSELIFERTVKYHGNWSNVGKFDISNIPEGLYYIDFEDELIKEPYVYIGVLLPDPKRIKLRWCCHKIELKE